LNTSASQIFLNTDGAASTGPIVLASTNAELTCSGGGSITWTNGAQGIISAEDGSNLEVANVISGPGGMLSTSEEQRRSNSFSVRLPFVWFVIQKNLAGLCAPSDKYFPRVLVACRSTDF
jgi:hypothetical protein